MKAVFARHGIPPQRRSDQIMVLSTPRRYSHSLQKTMTFAYNEQSVIPSIEWRSRANGTDCEETSNKK